MLLCLESFLSDCGEPSCDELVLVLVDEVLSSFAFVTSLEVYKKNFSFSKNELKKKQVQLMNVV